MGEEDAMNVTWAMVQTRPNESYRWMDGSIDTYPDFTVYASLTPLGRLVAPETVAAAVAYLVSDDARDITGVLLPVDGGRTL
jgi:NAD(P)-dependent dehydrogenase (short-subunit alcohol dehydrogenase family)